MNEQDRQRAIHSRLARMEQRAPGVLIPTGFAALDRALGVGGLPRGAIVELFGPAGCGKTTLALQMAAHLQQEGGTAAWIDAEHAFDAAYAVQLGVAIERLPVAQPESAEEALTIAERLAVSGAVDLLIVDSAAALVPQLELDAGMGASGPGLPSRVLASGLRRLSLVVRKSGAAVLFLNQMRMRAGPSGGEAETTSGGPALKLHAAVRIALGRAGAREVRFRILKNRVATAFSEGVLSWNEISGFAETL
ncbi:MAG: DNA recombination/repair protein RecA [Acidobacteriia bacterium]|nr:DNA recombination/repair protein RecA [Terriglobia bacterium]